MGNLFKEKKVITRPVRVDSVQNDMIKAQADLLMKQYNRVCFSAKHLQEILGVSRDSVYTLLKSGKIETIQVGRQKKVNIMALATFLVKGNAS